MIKNKINKTDSTINDQSLTICFVAIIITSKNKRKSTIRAGFFSWKILNKFIVKKDGYYLNIFMYSRVNSKSGICLV